MRVKSAYIANSCSRSKGSVQFRFIQHPPSCHVFEASKGILHGYQPRSDATSSRAARPLAGVSVSVRPSFAAGWASRSFISLTIDQ